MAIPQGKKPSRAPEDFQDRLAQGSKTRESSIVRIYDLRSTHATRLSAGGVADEWVTQLLRQGDAKVFKKYSQMKRDALEKIDRHANEVKGFDTVEVQ